MILPSAIILPLPEPVNNFVDQSTNKLKIIRNNEVPYYLIYSSSNAPVYS